MNELQASSPPSTPTTQTKAFSLASADVEAIEAVRQEENLMSDSAALRWLLREGLKYRSLRQQAERELMGKILTVDLHAEERARSEVKRNELLGVSGSGIRKNKRI